jgi:hypothetical protein
MEGDLIERGDERVLLYARCWGLTHQIYEQQIGVTFLGVAEQ